MDDLGFIGCYSDVRYVIQVECAGKQSCNVDVVGIEADSKCSLVFKDHLSVDYLCIKGRYLYF